MWTIVDMDFSYRIQRLSWYPTIMVDESTRIRVIRAILGWDMKRLAKRLEVGQNTITGWERGRHYPNKINRKVLGEICQENNIAIRPDGFPVPVE